MSGLSIWRSKFDTTYGRVEARIKASTTLGLWPAFWMLGSDFFAGTPWPYGGEIDILEHIGREPNLVHSTLHAPAYLGGGGFGAPLDLGGSVGAEFHVFAVEWDAGHLTFFVDGNASFIILDNAVGGDWPGPPGPGTVLPQNMMIDYLRVYH